MLVLEIEGSTDYRLSFCCHLVASCREYQILRNSQSSASSRKTDPHYLEARPRLG